MFFPVGCLYGTVNLSCDAQFCKNGKTKFLSLPGNRGLLLNRPIIPSWIRSSVSPPIKNMAFAFFPHEWFVLVQHIIHDCGIPSPKRRQKVLHHLTCHKTSALFPGHCLYTLPYLLSLYNRSRPHPRPADAPYPEVTADAVLRSHTPEHLLLLTHSTNQCPPSSEWMR